MRINKNKKQVKHESNEAQSTHKLIGINYRRRSQGLKPIFEELSNGSVGVELGSHKGASAVAFVASGKVKKLYCVDNWGKGFLDIVFRNKEEGIESENIFDHNTKIYPEIRKIKSLTAKSSHRFKDESLDFVYIDACHDYSYVKEDILSYLPKVKVGGIISGHDYVTEQNCKKRRLIERLKGVPLAVNEIFGKENVKVNSTNWYVNKCE